MHIKDLVILIKGGGDLGSGVAWRLFNSGLNVAIIDLPDPQAIRRQVAFSTAIREGETTVENVVSKRITSNIDFPLKWIPIFTTEDTELLSSLKPDVIIDATLKAIDNRTTDIEDAPLTIGLGNGFKAPDNIDCIIETNRGHNLGKVIWDGEAEEYTGIPGNIGGFTSKRLLRAPSAGVFISQKDIGDKVTEGDIIGKVGTFELSAPISGTIRGLIRPGSEVEQGKKIGDIDPRGSDEAVFTISDKARSIAGGVLEAVLNWYNRKYGKKI